ncbi:cytochrome c oxidase assembly protein [Methylobacillus flagellatus]|uniref:cytochrome c oxidase assembly protein n=1 Tax=Methylobacillus flagellatus TaxID=405 RepID=UPI002853C273|nr:cytochrome c oxidase assembly protein [Methylobacillus flagellatus]MDR5171410.1 cytochrome c oxidase assembly protein [Methylobacillus flagellatus]
MKRLAAFIACLHAAQAWAHPIDGHHHANPWLQLLQDYWVALPVGLALVLYLAGLYRLTRKAGRPTSYTPMRVKAFLLAWASLVAALFSPVDTLGNAYFSMHMVQHELLMIIAAPLFVIARPLSMWAWAFPRAAAKVGKVTSGASFSRFWRTLTNPLTAWTVHAGVLWGWHVPELFETALHYPLVHDLQHLSFFFSALLFWWSLMRLSNTRSPAVSGLVSLFTTALHTALLGALLTFSSRVWYHSYIIPAGSLELALQDQQLGGLIMWIPGGLAYLAVALAICYRLLSTESRSRPATKQAGG